MEQGGRQDTEQTRGFLAWIEHTGNKLPDPVFIFLWCIGAVVVISVIASLAGVSAMHPTQLDAAGNPLIIEAQSLLSASNVQRLLVDMPATFAGFYPLGFVLVVMLGAGVAERSGVCGCHEFRCQSGTFGNINPHCRPGCHAWKPGD